MDKLFFFRNILSDMCDFIVVGLVTGQRSDIEIILQDSFHAGVVPEEFESDLRFVAAEILSEKLLLIERRGFDAFLVKDTGYGGKAIALEIHIEYSSDDSRVFFYHDYLIRVLILEIAEGWYHDEALLLLLHHAGSHLFADITGVHIVE